MKSFTFSRSAVCLSGRPWDMMATGRENLLMFLDNRFGLVLAATMALRALSPNVGWAQGLSRNQPDSHAFTATAMLSRFDQNANGLLEADEVAAVAVAYSGIDVPMLPDEPFDYTAVRPPTYLKQSRLLEMDNTPDGNPLSNEGAALGRVLFHDRQLSQNNTIACASCHLQDLGFSDPRQLSVGFKGGHTGRNAMGLVNLRYSNLRGSRPGFFWDERAPTLEAQVLMPIQDQVEMGMQLDELVEKLKKLPYYPPLFVAAFGSTEVTAERIAKSVAQFMRAMTSWNSRFDRAASKRGDHAEDFDEFTELENLGKSLFINGIGEIAEFGCAHCHVPPTFGMPNSLNNGLDVQYTDKGLGALDLPSNDPFTPSNDGKFKSPSLRNVELTAPYMHDGRFKTLDEVIEHYSSQVRPHENLGLAFAGQDSTHAKLGFQFSEKQKAALVAFLKTLTDRDFISDPKFSDPFIRVNPNDN